jgi:hypothetical protein
MMRITVYLLLFITILVLYAVFYSVYTIRKTSETFQEQDEADKEKPTADVPECVLYNNRQEVINIIELYLGRKATPEEIDKYSKVGNMQDILTKVLEDFGLSSSDDKKSQLSGLRKDACVHKVVKPDKVEKYDDATVPATVPASVCIPYKVYQDAKLALTALQSQVELM